MLHQTFRGRTLDEAKRAAIGALGEGAVIVATRRVSKTGIAGLFGSEEIEVHAAPADDHDEPFARSSLAASVSSFSRARSRASLPSAGSSDQFSEGAYRSKEENGSNRDELKALRTEIKSELRAVRLAASAPRPQNTHVPAELLSEIANMRGAIDAMMTPSAPSGSLLSRILESRGIEGPVAGIIARKLAAGEADVDVDIRERIRDAVADEIRVMPWPVDHEGPCIVAMIGPAGVGKTTTAAKLAAHAIESGKTVTLVGADVFRVGAAMQLKRYAELLGANFVVASSATELARVLQRDNADLIIVDTSGQAVPEPGAPEAFLQRSAEGEGLRGRARYVLLCVPAALRAADARRVSGRYGALAPTGVVVTKLDETDAPAGLIHAAYATRLPTCALCFGPQVPDAIAPASRGAILDHLVPRTKSAASEIARKETAR